MKKLLKKTIAFALALACFAACLAGCGTGSTNDSTNNPAAPQDSGTEVAEKRTVRFGLSSDPGTLDPFSSFSGARRFTVLYPIYETLATQNGSIYELCMCKEYKEVEGAATPTYDVVLWDNIKDSAGNPFTADDLVWCVNLHKENGVVQEMAHVQGAEKIDDYTARITMSDTTVGAFLSFMMGTPMVTKAAYEASGDDKMATHPVGTGPYVLSGYTSGDKLTYARNENYWQPAEQQTSIFQKQNAETFEILIIKEATQAAIALQNGDIDFYDGITNEAAATFEENFPNISVGNVYSGGAILMFCNCSEGSVFADNLALRECVMHAVDVDAFITGVTNNVGVPLHDLASPFAVDYLDTFDSEAYFPFDIEYCKQKLEEAGYKPGELKLRILLATMPDCATLGLMMQANFEEIGIELELLNYENALYEQYKTNPEEWDLLIDISGLTYMADFYRKLDAREYSAETKSACFVDDDKLYELVALADSEDTTSDEAKQAAHDYVVEQAYARGIYSYGALYGYRNDVFSNVVFNSRSSCTAGCSEYTWDK